MRLLVGVLLIALGGLMCYLHGRLKFQRLNSAGIEQFNSYGHKIVSVAGERVLMLLGCTCLVVGVVFVA